MGVIFSSPSNQGSHVEGRPVLEDILGPYVAGCSALAGSAVVSVPLGVMPGDGSVAGGSTRGVALESAVSLALHSWCFSGPSLVTAILAK